MRFCRCQNLTLKDNIIFGQPFDQERYERVLHACALELDLQILQLGDQSKAGLRGINLSGGQRQRLNLARAAYFGGDLVLLVSCCCCCCRRRVRLPPLHASAPGDRPLRTTLLPQASPVDAPPPSPPPSPSPSPPRRTTPCLPWTITPPSTSSSTACAACCATRPPSWLPTRCVRAASGGRQGRVCQCRWAGRRLLVRASLPPAPLSHRPPAPPTHTQTHTHTIFPCLAACLQVEFLPQCDRVCIMDEGNCVYFGPWNEGAAHLLSKYLPTSHLLAAAGNAEQVRLGVGRQAGWSRQPGPSAARRTLLAICVAARPRAPASPHHHPPLPSPPRLQPREIKKKTEKKAEAKKEETVSALPTQPNSKTYPVLACLALAGRPFPLCHRSFAAKHQLTRFLCPPPPPPASPQSQAKNKERSASLPLKAAIWEYCCDAKWLIFFCSLFFFLTAQASRQVRHSRRSSCSPACLPACPPCHCGHPPARPPPPVPFSTN